MKAPHFSAVLVVAVGLVVACPLLLTEFQRFRNAFSFSFPHWNAFGSSSSEYSVSDRYACVFKWCESGAFLTINHGTLHMFQRYATDGLLDNHKPALTGDRVENYFHYEWPGIRHSTIEFSATNFNVENVACGIILEHVDSSNAVSILYEWQLFQLCMIILHLEFDSSRTRWQQVLV